MSELIEKGHLLADIREVLHTKMQFYNIRFVL